MSRTEIATLICVVLLGAIASLNQTNAECCRSFTVRYKCNRIALCSASICYDGTKVEGEYCGYRKCNPFGCDCAGGCRCNSEGLNKSVARRQFSDIYNVALP